MPHPQHPHPGEILLRKHMLPLSVSGNRLATVMRVPPNRVNDIVRGRRRISADTAHRLARAFKTTPEYWMDLQAGHDLTKSKPADLAKIKPFPDARARA